MTISFRWSITFGAVYAKKHSKVVKGISGAVSRLLFDYEWPGNVRQLRNFVESMVVVDTDTILDTDDLPPELRRRHRLGSTAIVGRPLGSDWTTLK